MYYLVGGWQGQDLSPTLLPDIVHTESGEYLRNEIIDACMNEQINIYTLFPQDQGDTALHSRHSVPGT